VYAVIKTGGKQERVEQGQTLSVELLGADEGQEVNFQPVLVVDGDSVLSSRDQLANASVSARVVGETKGPKVRGFTYKPKTRGRKAWGHRQRYTTIEITGITAAGPERPVLSGTPGPERPVLSGTPGPERPVLSGTEA
jgi:large subunit ribosomal protein L21